MLGFALSNVNQRVKTPPSPIKKQKKLGINRI